MCVLYSLGELIIDFTSVGEGSLKDVKQFIKNAGGAPANVCVQAVKFGQKAVYLSKVGTGGFGDFLIQSLSDEGVDTSNIISSPDYDTSLAFVSFTGSEREFSFYRKAAADLHFDGSDYANITFDRGDIFEFGSVALASEEGRTKHLELIRRAKAAGAVICFDPNLRFNLWDDHELLREVVMQFAAYADVIKVGKDELEWLLGCDGEAIPTKWAPTLKLMLLTDGDKGARVITGFPSYFNEREGRIYPSRYFNTGYKVNAVDTTGAGDSCFGAFIACLMEMGVTIDNIHTHDYSGALDWACKAGAYTTTGYGAIAAMGDKAAIESKIE